MLLVLTHCDSLKAHFYKRSLKTRLSRLLNPSACCHQEHHKTTKLRLYLTCFYSNEIYSDVVMVISQDSNILRSSALHDALKWSATMWLVLLRGGHFYFWTSPHASHISVWLPPNTLISHKHSFNRREGLNEHPPPGRTFAFCVWLLSPEHHIYPPVVFVICKQLMWCFTGGKTKNEFC